MILWGLVTTEEIAGVIFRELLHSFNKWLLKIYYGLGPTLRRTKHGSDLSLHSPPAMELTFQPFPEAQPVTRTASELSWS